MSNEQLLTIVVVVGSFAGPAIIILRHHFGRAPEPLPPSAPPCHCAQCRETFEAGVAYGRATAR